LERMKANGQTRCPCVTGVNLAGVKFGDDYSEQATEEEMKKLWTKDATIHTENRGVRVLNGFSDVGFL
jgi:hypothetical protein